MAKTNPPEDLEMGCGSSVVTLVLILGVFWFCGRSCNSTDETGLTGEHATPTASAPMTGEEGHVRYPGGGDNLFWLAANEAAFDAMMEAATGRDAMGLQQLASRGQIFAVPQGTRVLVLDQGFFKTKVRVLEGNARGRPGWASAEFVVR